MSTIQFGGVVSGLNTQGIIDALVAVKKQPLVDMQNKEATLTAQKAAYAQVGTALDDLVAKIKNFTVTNAGASRVGTSADNSVLTATAASNAAVSQYQISVDRLATATRATSTGALGAAVTGADASKTLQSLNLPGSVSAGQISAIVDGVVVHYTVGDPATTTLDQVMAGLGQAIQDQLVAGGNSSPDPTAVMTISVAGNRLQLAVSGATMAHSFSFGAASDSSNALGMLGIANSSATIAVDDPPLTGTTNLGVARMSGALDNAGLSGLTSTTAGKLTINGVDIAYDTTVDSLSTIVSRINNSSAGVIASIDRINDKLVLTRKDTGAVAMDIDDTSGNLAAVLKLAPGTTNAQKIGDTSQVTVDGRSITSLGNTVTNAIDGVTLNLVAKSPLGLPQTLTVGADQSAVTTALNSFITSYNSLADTLDRLTASTPGQVGGKAGTSGPLASDPTARSLLISLRATLFGSSGSGSINSLGAIGLNTGAIGSAAGTTDRLQLDTTKLTAAMNADAHQVAALLDGSAGPLSALLTRLKTIEDPANTSSYIQAHTAGLASEISSLQHQEIDRQELIANYQAAIERQYAAMEAILSQLQAQSAQLTSTLGATTSNG